MPLSTTITTVRAAPLYHPYIVYAEQRGPITHQLLPHDLPTSTDYYDVAICPELPLAVGRMIKICALSMETSAHHPLHPVQFHVYDPHSPHPIQFHTYDPQVEGRILGVRSAGGNMVEFVLENQIKDSVVSLAYVTVPYLPNITVKLSMVWRVFMWLTKNQHARLVQLKSAVIVETVTEFSLCSDRETSLVQKSECSDEQSDENTVVEELEEEIYSEGTWHEDELAAGCETVH